MPTENDLRKAQEDLQQMIGNEQIEKKLKAEHNMTLAQVMSDLQHVQDEIKDRYDPEARHQQELMDVLAQAKANYAAREARGETKVNHKIVENLQSVFALQQNLDRIAQMQEPITIEQRAVEEEKITDLELDTEDLVTALEDGFSNERGASTLVDIDEAIDVKMGEDFAKILPPSKPIPKLKHSEAEIEIDLDSMLASREALMPEVRKRRMEQIKKLNAEAEEHRKKNEENLRKIVARVGNKVSLINSSENETVFKISGGENLERLGFSEKKEGALFAFQIVKIYTKDHIPTIEFKLVDISDKFGGMR